MNRTRARLARMRKRMYKLQNGLCHLCGTKMAISKERADDQGYATFDHLLPKALGGTNSRGNLKLAHKRCNTRRGHTLLPGHEVVDTIGPQKGVGLAAVSQITTGE